MQSPIETIIHRASSSTKKLNILTFVTHERYEPNLCKTGHEFWSWQGGDIRQWNTQYAEVPNNYHILDGSLGDYQLPPHVKIDLIISQNLFAHLDLALAISDYSQVPVINVWHTLPPPGFDFNILRGNQEALSKCRHVFISDYNRREWGFNEDTGVVIRHGVDSNFWSPDNNTQRVQVALSVCNDWINRDVFCGFTQWHQAIGSQGVPCHVIGNTPGLSEPAPSLEALRDAYRASQVFVNTSTISPIPMALLEAMSCGCGVVSTNTCMIPEIITHGYNGYLVDPQDVEGLNRYTVELLNDAEKSRKLGWNARNTIKEMFGISRFVSEWESLIQEVVNGK